MQFRAFIGFEHIGQRVASPKAQAFIAHSSDEIGFEGDHIEIIFFFLFVFIPAAIFINDFCFRM